MYPNIPSAVKSVIQPSVGDLHEVILDFCSLWQFVRIDEVSGTHFLCPSFLARIGVNGNDARSLYKVRGLNDTQSDGTTSEHCNCGSLC
jgi:hypothetical protein